MSNSLVVIGAGGFGRETLDVVEAINAAAGGETFDLLGVVDSAPSSLNLERLEKRSVRYLGTEHEWISRRENAQFIVGVGSTSARRTIAERFIAAGFEPATLVHPSAGIGSQTVLGVGAVICAGVQVSTNVALGRHVHLNPNATIGHDSHLEEYVSVNPGAIVSGDVLIRSGALLGAGAVVLQGLEVGRNSIIGASACVVRNVPDDVTVKGIPARY